MPSNAKYHKVWTQRMLNMCGLGSTKICSRFISRLKNLIFSGVLQMLKRQITEC